MLTPAAALTPPPLPPPMLHSPAGASGEPCSKGPGAVSAAAALAQAFAHAVRRRGGPVRPSLPLRESARPRCLRAWGASICACAASPSPALWWRQSRCREGRSTKSLGRVLTAPARLPSPLRYGHEWFRGFNFASLRKQTMRPPFTPTLGGPDDTRYFIDCGERLPSWREIRAFLCVCFVCASVRTKTAAPEEPAGGCRGRCRGVWIWTLQVSRQFHRLLIII